MNFNIKANKMRTTKLLFGVLLVLFGFSTIFSFAQNNDQNSNNLKREKYLDLQTYPDSTPQLYNDFLINVKDINVETAVGFLPKLPRYINCVYKDDFPGPDVRVLWPAPEDNNPVLKAGTYTLKG